MGDIRENASGKFEKAEETQEMFLTVNTIDNAVFLERLPDPERISRGRRTVLYYGNDNLYPNKVVNMSKRSKTATSAIKTHTRFSVGKGFAEISGVDINTTIVNRKNQTLKDILVHAAKSKSALGVAIHFNYNQFGEIIEINEARFETLRWKHDLSRLVYCRNWAKSGIFSKSDAVEYFPFNPENAANEIAEVGGIDKYPGQILYWIPETTDIYPLAQYDSVLDDVQFEHESGVFKLRNIQNGYAANYMIFYPQQIQTELEKQGVIKGIRENKGAKNSGKSLVIPLNAGTMENLGSRKMIEEIPRTGIDKLFEKQNKETVHNIYSAFNQPPILNGVATDGMFNQESFVDAFDYYNSITETDRQDLQRIFNSFMPYTLLAIDGLEIEPLEFISERENVNNQENSSDGDNT